MNKPIKVIGFDIDDVVYDFHGPLLDFINNKKGTKHLKEHLTTWDIDSHLSIDRKEFKELVKDSKVYEKGELCENFKSLYNNFKDQGYKIVFISSRFDLSEFNINTLEITRNWLKLHGIEGHIEITDDKLKAVIDNEVELFIDDGLHNIISIGEGIEKLGKNIDLYLLDKPWNGNNEIKRLSNEKGYPIVNTKYNRVNSLHDIKHINDDIKNITNKKKNYFK